MTTHATPSRGVRLPTRLLIAAVVGAAAGLVVPLPQDMDVIVRVILGFIVAALAFSVPLAVLIWRTDADRTEELFASAEPTRSVVDTIVVVAGVASLGAIALLLGGGSNNAHKVVEPALTLATVAVAWLSIHITYVLRYARHYLVEEPGCIDFNSKTKPRLSDFAYFAFTLGMTYQVSDTDLTTPRIRKVVLAHTLLSYVFGTVIIAATINLVAGLAK